MSETCRDPGTLRKDPIRIYSNAQDASLKIQDNGTLSVKKSKLAKETINFDKNQVDETDFENETTSVLREKESQNMDSEPVNETPSLFEKMQQFSLFSSEKENRQDSIIHNLVTKMRIGVKQYKVLKPNYLKHDCRIFHNWAI